MIEESKEMDMQINMCYAADEDEYFGAPDEDEFVCAADEDEYSPQVMSYSPQMMRN